MRKLFFVIALIPVLASCHLIHSNNQTHLEILERQINEKPEQTLTELRQIDPASLTPSQRAYYYLINAIALDKNFTYADTDSTLRIALHFYQTHKNHYQIARCQYYLGKYSLKTQHYEEAYTLFRQAEVNLQTSEQTDPHFQGLLCYQISRILNYQGQPEEAFLYSSSALRHFLAIRDTLSAVYALKLKGIQELEKGDTNKARLTFCQAHHFISNLNANFSEKAFRARIAVLSALSQYYRETNAPLKAILHGREAIQLFLKEHKSIPSASYKELLISFQKLQERDSIRYYSKQMIQSALAEKNDFNLLYAYQTLAELEKTEGHYQTAYELRFLSGQLKDSLYHAISRQRLRELKERNASLQQSLMLKDENDRLKNIRLFLIITFSLCTLAWIVYYRHRKLQLENNKLAERVKHTTWGFSVTQEFIRQNHIAFHQLIKILNQEKLTGNLSTKVYNLLYQTLIKQNSDYSGNLMNRLTNLDGAFAQKFQERFPNFNTDEILMATMIHHKWKLTHMAAIFQTTLEAIRKRKTRLLNRISDKLQQDTDPEEYLIQL